MSTIIKMRNKQNGVTYVYESESYWDKEKKQPRSRRKLIGKIDEATGEIVSTGKRKDRETESADATYTDSQLKELCEKQSEELKQLDDEIISLKKQLMETTLTLKEYERRLSKVNELAKI